MLTSTENRPDVVDLREIKLPKQRRKKSGPPCGVDFKRELTSRVLTSRGFHCMLSKEFTFLRCNWFYHTIYLKAIIGLLIDISFMNTLINIEKKNQLT